MDLSFGARAKWTNRQSLVLNAGSLGRFIPKAAEKVR